MTEKNEAIPISETLTQIYERKRAYAPTNDKPRKPKYSRFKMKFYFDDDNGFTPFSYDRQPGKKTAGQDRRTEINDEWEGLRKLVRCAHSPKFKGTYKSCIIWATIEQGKPSATARYDIEIARFMPGWEDCWNESLSFQVKENGDTIVRLDLLKQQRTVAMALVTKKFLK